MRPSEGEAKQRAHMPEGTQRILNARSLRTAHRRLAALLRPGLKVLDVGCGTGAITRDVAAAVAPRGEVLGVDANAALIDEARRMHGDVPGLSFEVYDVYTLPFRAAFDLVSAARVLQWLARPLDALEALVAATKPGGHVVILDYNHEKVVWHPSPPPSMRAFYEAFLRWRAEARMDNAVADHLAALCAQVGLVDVIATPQHELSERTDPDFQTRLGLWAEVAATRGHQMVSDGVITEPQRATAEADYRAWLRDDAAAQSLYLIAVEGTRPLSAPACSSQRS
jgi:ubiquinone/menaquinone biosynthesis C-methylase UbiE